MPRWLQALLAALSVALVLALLGSIALEVHWQVTHRAEDDAADARAVQQYRADRHHEQRVRDAGNRAFLLKVDTATVDKIE